MNTRPKIAYYSSGKNGSLEQPLIYGLKSLGFIVQSWVDMSPHTILQANSLFIFLARDHWPDNEKNKIKALIDAQHPCFIASPCKHEIIENPCLKKAIDVFGEDLPIIYPPYDMDNLARQLGVQTAAVPEHINQVLLVDDSPTMLAVLEHCVTDLGYPCYATVSAKDALKKVESGAFDILLTDYQMDEMNGIELIERSRELFSDIKSILVTGFGDKSTILDAIGIHVDAFLEKPVDFEILKSKLTRLENLINMRKENSRLLVELTESNTYLKEGRDILTVTLESLNEAVLTLSNDFKIISANNAVNVLTQHSINSLLGKSIHLIFPENDWKNLYHEFDKMESGWSTESEVSRKDGVKFPATLTLRRSTEVSRGFYILVIRDISSQKKVESNLLSINEVLESKVIERTQKIEEAKEDAERANQTKSEFLANMSHELRTPMHAIMSFNALIDKNLGHPDIPEKIQNKVKGFTFRISESSKRLLRLINNLLDISKLESGHTDLQKTTLDIMDIIQNIKSDISPLLKEKGLTVNIKCQAKSTKLHADAEKLTQVIYNLLSNACKFSAKTSSIDINLKDSRVNIERRDATPYLVPSLEISICDYGVGIPIDEIDSIFDKFIQSSKTKTGAGGTGLGLAICKEIVDLHRGDIHATSNNNNGACFIFNIPLSSVDWSQNNKNKGKKHEH